MRNLINRLIINKNLIRYRITRSALYRDFLLDA